MVDDIKLNSLYRFYIEGDKFQIKEEYLLPLSGTAAKTTDGEQ